jgi:hypothetical protein
MARIEWIKNRLNNWALWKVRESSGGLGFATSSIFLANRVDSSRDAPLPVDEVDASKTDQAVESLRPDKLHLYTTLQLVYVKGIGIRATARHIGRAESTVKANLDQADHALSAWFGQKAEQDQLKRTSLNLGERLRTNNSLST